MEINNLYLGILIVFVGIVASGTWLFVAPYLGDLLNTLPGGVELAILIAGFAVPLFGGIILGGVVIAQGGSTSVKRVKQ